VSAASARLTTAGLLAIVAFFAIGALFPVFWMVTTSLKPGGDVFLVPPRWLPSPIMWRNYPDALAFMDAATVFRNSFLVAGLSVVGTTLVSATIAFPFARLRAPGSNVLFMLVLSTLLLPSQVTLIPEFLLFKYLGWVDTLKPLWVPFWFGTPYACSGSSSARSRERWTRRRSATAARSSACSGGSSCRSRCRSSAWSRSSSSSPAGSSSCAR
jgi:ABC-type glycerol-3-phosphate transport system permease component